MRAHIGMPIDKRDNSTSIDKAPRDAKTCDASPYDRHIGHAH
jgi:hypothetical protein